LWCHSWHICSRLAKQSETVLDEHGEKGASLTFEVLLPPPDQGEPGQEYMLIAMRPGWVAAGGTRPVDRGARMVGFAARRPPTTEMHHG
jgi:hypothetical protein